MLFRLKKPFFRAVANGSWLTLAIAVKAGAAGLLPEADGGASALPPGSSGLPTIGNSPDVVFGRVGSLPPRLLFQDPLAKVSLETALSQLDGLSIIYQPSGSLAGSEASQPSARLAESGLNLVMSQPVAPIHYALISSVPSAASAPAVVLDPASAPQFSIDSSNPNLKGIDPAVVIPEPSSFSLLVVGLVVMGLAYRSGMFPKKFSYFVSEDCGEINSVTTLPEDCQSQYILCETTKTEPRSRFDFFAVAI